MEKSNGFKFFTSVDVTNKFIKDMKKNWGRIINITSIAGIEISGPSTFNASKAALTAYSRSVGRQLAIEKRNIVMTAVAPGVIPTEKWHWNKNNLKSKHKKYYLKHRTALGRFGTIDELTGIIVFLCSDKASFFHGSIIQPDEVNPDYYVFAIVVILIKWEILTVKFLDLLEYTKKNFLKIGNQKLKSLEKNSNYYLSKINKKKINIKFDKNKNNFSI